MFSSLYHQLDSLAEEVLALRRTAQRFVDVVAVDEEYGLLLPFLRDLRPRALLVDLRATPGRNDPAFEEALKEHRRVLLTLAPRTALLVSTATGELQVRRHLQIDGLHQVEVTRDEDQAHRFVLG